MRTQVDFNPTEIEDVLKYFILSRLAIPLIFLMCYFEESNIFMGLGIAATSVILISYFYFNKNEEDPQLKLTINLDSAAWILVLGIFLNVLFEGHQYLYIIQPLLISLSGFLIASNTVLIMMKRWMKTDKTDSTFDAIGKSITFLTIIMIITPLFLIMTAETNHIFEYYQSIEWSYPAFLDYEFDFITFMGYYGILVIISLAETVIFVLIIKKLNQSEKKEPPIAPKKFNIFAQVMKDFDPINWLYLGILLIFASLWEEVIFRFIGMNLIDWLGAPYRLVILITALAFGIAHRSGGIFHIISAFDAGLIFGIVYFTYGIFYVWILHLFWNILVMVQLWILQAQNQE